MAQFDLGEFIRPFTYPDGAEQECMCCALSPEKGGFCSRVFVLVGHGWRSLSAFFLLAAFLSLKSASGAVRVEEDFAGLAGFEEGEGFGEAVEGQALVE